MIIKFNCTCGNTNPQKAKLYEGALGYSAIVCKVCGMYYDHNNKHIADDWSKKFVGLSVK
jgi:transcription elongation factor Elf1